AKYPNQYLTLPTYDSLGSTGKYHKKQHALQSTKMHHKKQSPREDENNASCENEAGMSIGVGEGFAGYAYSYQSPQLSWKQSSLDHIGKGRKYHNPQNSIFLASTKTAVGAPPSENNKSKSIKYQNRQLLELLHRLLLIPLVFVFLRMPGSLRNVIVYTTPSFQDTVWNTLLQYLQTAFDPAQGLCNAILFVATVSRVRKELRRSLKKICCKCGFAAIETSCRLTEYLCCCVCRTYVDIIHFLSHSDKHSNLDLAHDQHTNGPSALNANLIEKDNPNAADPIEHNNDEHRQSNASQNLAPIIDTTNKMVAQTTYASTQPAAQNSSNDLKRIAQSDTLPTYLGKKKTRSSRKHLKNRSQQELSVNHSKSYTLTDQSTANGSDDSSEAVGESPQKKKKNKEHRSYTDYPAESNTNKISD
ncbi:hypothetical protein RFI_08144, partial [Reticulomyxa filosa]